MKNDWRLKFKEGAEGTSNTYGVLSNSQILEVLKNSPQFDKRLVPTEIELDYVSSVFESKGLTNIENITPAVIDELASGELKALNKRLKEFSKLVSNTSRTEGIGDLIEALQKHSDTAEIENIWYKAVTYKPNMFEKFVGFFRPKYLKRSFKAHYEGATSIISSISSNAESKLLEIEKNLYLNKEMQLGNIKALEKAFNLYYESFEELRKKFILVVCLEHIFTKHLEEFSHKDEYTLEKVKSELERNLRDIRAKRFLIHKSMLHLPLAVEQNDRLISASRTLVSEIDNVILGSIPIITSNMISITSALSTEKAMLLTESTAILEQQSSRLASKVSGNLVAKTLLMSGNMAIKDANVIKDLIANIDNINKAVDSAKLESREKFDEASRMLIESTSELRNILSENNGQN